MFRELHALLAASRESGPYVLVGHSFGGYNVRVYTSRYPKDVAGLVLVDASQEDEESVAPASMRTNLEELRAASNWQRILAPVLIRIGIARFVFPAGPMGKLSEETRDKIAYLNLQSKDLADGLLWKGILKWTYSDFLAHFPRLTVM